MIAKCLRPHLVRISTNGEERASSASGSRPGRHSARHDVQRPTLRTRQTNRHGRQTADMESSAQSSRGTPSLAGPGTLNNRRRQVIARARRRTADNLRHSAARQTSSSSNGAMRRTGRYRLPNSLLERVGDLRALLAHRTHRIERRRAQNVPSRLLTSHRPTATAPLRAPLPSGYATRLTRSR